MVTRVHSALIEGIDARPVEVEVDLDDRGLAKETVVGLPDAAVKESLDRVKAAMANAGYPFPPGKVLINLAPADVRKEGPMYDLPVAVGLLAAQGVLITQAGPGTGGVDPRTFVIAGELALDGRVRPIKGALAIADMARRRGFAGVIVPAGNASEAAVVGGIDVIGVSTLAEVVGVLSGALEIEPHPPVDVESLIASAEAPVDFADVRGQEGVKRAIVIAAAGSHNLVMVGPAGTGKTMMAKALPGILPPLSPTEAIETTRVYSAAGMLDSEQGIVAVRPVRSPHHTASAPAVVGGGIVPRPGEISLAHHGVLFLDELPEFPRPVLETLRQPLEDDVVTIARAAGTVRFPARFMLVAAMNPSHKGGASPGAAGQREMERYLGRLSGPLLDRIDIHVEAPSVKYEELRSGPVGVSSADMRAQVIRARAIARGRQGEDRTNARLTGRQLDRWAPLDQTAETLLGQAITELGLSARAYDKIRRVARTIADLDERHAGDETPLTSSHVAEAVGYRLLDRRV
ncbi:MAG: ATP-dependent protease [Phycisphaeraceae bacterium]|nr:MAG: ATP-dependent protease [Phycisphaeraceae bacterium]